jgi:non-heme Fe2+,alpha-ketoglutarate-dependent halogenase
MEKHGEVGGAEERRAGPIRRLFICGVMAFVLLIKPFKSLRKKLPPRMRELARSWDSQMLWTFISSFGHRFYTDQNCTLKDPPSFKPLVKTKADWQFSEEQIKSFYENGFIGPITLWTPEEMVAIRRKVDAALDRKSTVYPKAANSHRDRYIDVPEFWEVISSPQIVERLAQLLGPDLLVWRSQIFNKQPGDGEITWHQASTYMSEQRIKAAIEPADLNKLFQLTTWIAIDDAFPGNGCMHFLKGTHRKMWTVYRGNGPRLIGNPPELAKLIAGEGRFMKAESATLEVPITEDTIVPMPLKSGQCVIFAERTIHGSPPNTSDKRRFGFTFRTIRTDVQVYREESTHEVTYLKESYDLEKWGCAALRGEDKHHLNRMITPPVYTDKEVAVPAGH